jgi:GT2 family glycosyltransferase/glycosyltransferase involved in cell wall biosynthesis
VATAARPVVESPRPLEAGPIVGFTDNVGRSRPTNTVGAIDGLLGSAVIGWAYDRNFGQRRIGIAMYVDDQLVAETIANGLRQERVGIGNHDGFSGFVCPIPPENFTPGAVVRIFADGVELTDPPLLLGPDQIDGIFEPIENATMRGWVRERVAEPMRARLGIYIDGSLVRSLIADRLRDDLLVFGISDGKFGFAEPLPAMCFDGGEHEIELRHETSGAVLTPGPQRFRASHVGMVEQLDPQGGVGWIYCREAPERPVVLDIVVNGERFRIVADRPRPDLRASQGVAAWGFEFATPDAVSRHHRIAVDIFLAGTANRAIPGPLQVTPVSRLIEQLESFAATLDVEAEAQPPGSERPYSPVRDAIVPALVGALRSHYRGGPLDVALRLDLTRFHASGAAIDEVVDVIIPVYAGYDQTIACIESVIHATNTTRREIIVVDDCGPEPRLRRALFDYERAGAIALLVNPSNLGFPASANAGMALRPDRDVILLNSDTLVPDGWIDRLRGAAYRSANTGSVTPLSNRATICSYPEINRDNDLPGEIGWQALDQICASVNRETVVEIPTAVGFCVYLKRAMLREVGLLNAERWRRGYGEENELCILAAARGWKHLLAADLFVVHHGAVSFGVDDRKALLETNLGTLNQFYPDYIPRVMDFLRADPVAAARRAIDWARLRRLSDGFMLFVCHRYGGGTMLHVEDMARRLAAEGQQVLILEANTDDRGIATIRNPTLGTRSVYALPSEREALVDDLLKCGIRHVHFHQIMGSARWAALPAQLGCAYDVTVHDYSYFCPRIDLIDETRRYCGEPTVEVCERCIAFSQPHPELQGAFREHGGVAEWLRFHTALLTGARRVFVPSRDTAARMARHIPGVDYQVRYHPEPARTVAIRHPASAAATRVAVIGAIGPNKGYDLLLACARAALRQGLPIQYNLFGYTEDETPLRQLDNVRRLGEYVREDLPRLLAENPCDLALFLSIWPETYCYALSDAYAAGLYPIALGFGALEERITATKVGTLLPLASTPAEINAAILREVAQADRWPATVKFGGEPSDLLGEYLNLKR